MRRVLAAFTAPMNRHIAILLLTGCLSLAGGCATHHARMAPPPPPETILGDESYANTQASLFKGDQAVLSDQEIARILGTEVRLADRHRLAILNLDSTNPWSQDLSDAEAKNFENLVRTLKSSPQLTDVRFLPSLLVPEKKTVPYLREAAARIQADFLFVYEARIQTFRRDRVFHSDEVHAQCVAESVLLDVRTGIVVHTARDTEGIAMTKAPSDLNFSETIARAESEARGKGVLALAGSVTSYLAQAGK